MGGGGYKEITRIWEEKTVGWNRKGKNIKPTVERALIRYRSSSLELYLTFIFREFQNTSALKNGASKADLI